MFVIGFVVTATATAIRVELLSASPYKEALVAADVYERIYTEMLADPGFAATQEQA